MQDVVADLAAQQSELAVLLDGVSAQGWSASTRCAGWDVADVVLHLAQTDAMALAAVTGGFSGITTRWQERVGPVGSVDEGASLMVAAERGPDHDALRRRWRDGCARLVAALDAADLSARVPWVAGELSARTLATTRLAETWIHSGDVAAALGRSLEPGDRLAPIARLAWRTLPYAFASAGRRLAGPVAFRLVAPSGAAWDYVPGEPPTTTVRGPAVELCEVAARRVDPSTTSLSTEGPDGDAVLALVRTYA